MSTEGDVGAGEQSPVHVPGLTAEIGSPPSCEPRPWFIRVELGEYSTFARIWPVTDPEPQEWTIMALRPPGGTSVLGLFG